MENDYQLPKRRAGELLERFPDVTIEDVRRVAIRAMNSAGFLDETSRRYLDAEGFLDGN